MEKVKYARDIFVKFIYIPLGKFCHVLDEKGGYLIA